VELAAVRDELRTAQADRTEENARSLDEYKRLKEEHANAEASVLAQALVKYEQLRDSAATDLVLAREEAEARIAEVNQPSISPPILVWISSVRVRCARESEWEAVCVCVY
jgi:hypothetical protein